MVSIQDVWGDEPVVLYAGTTGVALFRADTGQPEGATVTRMLHIEIELTTTVSS